MSVIPGIPRKSLVVDSRSRLKGRLVDVDFELSSTLPVLPLLKYRRGESSFTRCTLFVAIDVLASPTTKEGNMKHSIHRTAELTTLITNSEVLVDLPQKMWR